MRQSAGGVMGSAAESRKRGRGHAGYQKWLAPRGLGRGRGTSARDTYRPASILIELVERLSTRGDVLLRERHLRVAKEDSLRSRTAGMSQRLSLLRQLLVDSSFDETGHGLLVRWSVIVSVASTSHELEKNVVCLNRSRRLGLTADGTFSGF